MSQEKSVTMDVATVIAMMMMKRNREEEKNTAPKEVTWIPNVVERNNVPQCEQLKKLPCFSVFGHILPCSAFLSFAFFKSLRARKFDPFKNVRVPSQELLVHLIIG